MNSRSPPRDASSSVPRLEVSALQEDTRSKKSNILFKLTDECNAAIRKAMSERLPIRMRFDKNSATLEIGRPGSDTLKFQCMIQPLDSSTSVDAISFDRNQRQLATSSSVRSKIQVQATEKSFAETREKAKKLVDEEQKKKAKDLAGHRQNQKLPGSRPIAKPFGRPSNSLPPRSSDLPNKASSSSYSSTSSKPGQTAKPDNGHLQQSQQRSSAAMALKSELMKRTLRSRTVHHLATGRFSSPEELFKRIEHEGLPADESPSDAFNRVMSIIHEVGDTTKSKNRLHLKPSAYNELDARWPWFTSEEKSYVRKMLSGNSSSTTSSNFAPTRKNKTAPPQAPAAPQGSSVQRRSPENGGGSEASAPNSGSSENSLDGFTPSNGTPTGKPKEASPEATRTFKKRVAPSDRSSPAATKPNATPDDEPIVDSGVEAKRRCIAHDTKTRMPSVSPLESAGGQERSAPTGESKTPPKKSVFRAVNTEDKSAEKKTQKQSKTDAALSATMESMVPSNNEAFSRKSFSPDENNLFMEGCLTQPSRPTCDWSKIYREIETVTTAQEYHQLFNSEYPVYQRCFNTLWKVRNEFMDLERDLRRAPRNTPDHETVERKIQSKFAEYQRDKDFIDARQKHADLRAKLEVLKQRISSWENAQRAQLAKDRLVSSRVK